MTIGDVLKNKEQGKKRITGHPPDFCDLCGEHFMQGWPDEEDTCYDGKTTSGPWAWMCRACFMLEGMGLGTGRGQKFVYNEEDNKWYKEEG